ncbi:MAG: single-stranded-DNA-specific exonuclease RecJ, partial [Clostridia bacterium]|nr:single-stranded-DNA-specific exonuclease RecJ [Clostridia bacterium]
MNKKWEYYEKDEEKVKVVQEQFGLSRLLATIIVNKGLQTKEEIEVFLNPTRKDFHDPYLMPDMKIAVDRIVKAIENQEKVIIYGDYDVDGITSITVLKKFLADRGLQVDSYIPNRLDEGYGLNKAAIENIVKQGYQLMITVDCGISGIEEI